MVAKQNPATLAACGAPVDDLAAGKVNSEDNKHLRFLQAVHLSRRCAIAASLADALAPFVYGGAR